MGTRLTFPAQFRLYLASWGRGAGRRPALFSPRGASLDNLERGAGRRPATHRHRLRAMMPYWGERYCGAGGSTVAGSYHCGGGCSLGRAYPFFTSI